MDKDHNDRCRTRATLVGRNSSSQSSSQLSSRLRQPAQAQVPAAVVCTPEITAPLRLYTLMDAATASTLESVLISPWFCCKCTAQTEHFSQNGVSLLYTGGRARVQNQLGCSILWNTKFYWRDVKHLQVVWTWPSHQESNRQSLLCVDARRLRSPCGSAQSAQDTPWRGCTLLPAGSPRSQRQLLSQGKIQQISVTLDNCETC